MIYNSGSCIFCFFGTWLWRIDEDRRRNAELFEEAFYEKKNLDPKMRDETATQTVDVPEDVDAELLAKVLANPEMKALLASLAKTMK